MQYILTQEEMNALVPKGKLERAEAKIEMLVREYKKVHKCWKENGGVCDDCPISSLKNGLKPYSNVCAFQEYSK